MSILSGKSSTVPISERPIISSSCTNTALESDYDDTADSEGMQKFQILLTYVLLLYTLHSIIIFSLIIEFGQNLFEELSSRN
jgi:hypothetical protein